MTMSDRISIMNDGEIQQVAPPLACYNEPANLFVAGFIGSPSMNFMEGEIVENGFQAPHVHLEFDPGTFGLKAGREVTLGIRPEDVYPAESGRSLGTPTAEFATTSDVLEPMGDEIFVYLLLDADADVDMVDMQEGGGGNQLLMSVSPDSDIEPDEQVSVVFDRSKVHLFDTETGDAIEHGLVRPTETGGAAGTGAETDD
jgi:multiple sugar transport system ATP-binding protein